MRRCLIIMASLLAFSANRAFSQASALTCNDYTPLISSQFANLTTDNDNFSNTSKLTNSDLTDYASWGYIVYGTGWIEVKDNNATGTNVYPAGAYAGFVIDDNSINILSGIKVATYLGNTKQEEESGSSLLALSILSGKERIGFTTTKTFDRIRITFSALGLTGTAKVYYAEVLKPCAGPVPTCNVPTALTAPTYPAVIVDSHTGVGGISFGSVSSENNVVDADLNNYATINLTVGIAASGSISVKDGITDHPAGYFAGFEVSNATLAGVNLLASTTIQTYLNGAPKETKTNGQLFLSVPLLIGSSRQTIGFVTSLPFDEIRYTINQTGVNLGTTQVYNAVIKKYCAGPDLVCNTPTAVYEPVFPVNIDGSLSGINGAVCASCIVSNTGNIIDNDNTTYGNITLVAGAIVSGSVAVINGYDTYPANTYAAFDIKNVNLIGANLFSGITVSTYLNGVPVESKTGSTQLVSVTSSLLNGAGTQRVGFVASQPFDEVRLTISQGATLNLGTTQVYNLVIEKLCAGPTPDCSTITSLINPTYPAVLNNTLTGVSGVACAFCAVNNTPNVVDADLTNYASIVLTADVLSNGSISVQDPISTYPAGTFAGFDIENNILIGANLLTAGNVSTYLDGVFQESESGRLITLSLLSSSRQIVGFNTTKPFDEVRFTVGNLVGVNVGTTRVYRAIIKGGSAAGTTAPVISSILGTINLPLANVCPLLTANLNSAVTSTTPAGAQLVWYTTNTTPPTGTPYATPTAAASGTYYAYYYDPIKGCYSLPSRAVVVLTISCITLTTESGTVSSLGGRAITNVVANDKLNGATPTLGPSGNATISQSGIWPAGITLDPLTGAVDVAPGKAPGTYPVDYTLCDKAAKPTCKTITDYVIVATILPADGLELKAVRSNNKILVSWSTLTEQNTNYFAVDQSNDGVNFSQIGKVAAAGSSNAKKEYSLYTTDQQLSATYFRVKLVDIDGKEKYSNVVTVRSQKAFIALYPTPATTTLYVKLGNLKGAQQIAILDLQGKQLQQETVQVDNVSTTLTLDVSSLPAGVYVLKINNESGVSEFRKFVVAK